MNPGTLIVALALLAVIGLIVFRLIRDRKHGKSTCGCGCADCPMNGSCHGK